MITHGNVLTSIIQYAIFGQEVTKVQGVGSFPFGLFSPHIRPVIAAGLERTRWQAGYV